MPILRRKTQASGKVHAYLNALLATSDDTPLRLPSVRQLASHLEVSTSTVVSVYRKMREDGLIESVAGSGSHLKRNSQPPLRVTTNIPTVEAMLPGSWYSELMGGLTMAALKAGKTLALRAMDSIRKDELTVSQLYRDVALIFPAKPDRQMLIDWAGTHQLPTIHLNPAVDNSTENFVAADYFSASRLLGSALLKSGRKRVLYLSHTPFSASTSNRLRVSGLLTGLDYGTNNGVDFEMVFTNSETTKEAGRQGLLQYIEKHRTHPDAIYAPGDFMGIGCYMELLERGVRIPEEASIIGGTGLTVDRSECPLLTRMSHPYEALGKELVSMLLDQLAHPERPSSGRILPMGWLGGATTTECENSVLFA